MASKRLLRQILRKTKDELRGSLTDMATPLDVADLVDRGVLKKSGNWYILLKPDELPRHAWSHVKSAVSITENGKHTDKLQFRDTTKVANTLLKKYFDQ